MAEQVSVERADNELRELEAWIVRAAAALLTFWNTSAERFDRNITTCVDPDWKRSPVPEKGRVSTTLAVPALRDYLRFLEENADSLGDKDAISSILGADLWVLGRVAAEPTRRCATEVVCRAARQLDSWCKDPDFLKTHQSPHHLASQAALALYYHRGLRDHWPGCPELVEAVNAYKALHAYLDKSLWERSRDTSRGADYSRTVLARHGNRPDDEPNYFITFGALRAHDLCALENVKGDNEMWDLMGRVVDMDLQSFLGQQLGNVARESTVADTVFAAAALDRLEEENARPIVDRAIELAVTSQRGDGSWSCPPVISREESVLQVSSYDIAYGLSCLLLNQFARDRWQNAEPLLESFQRVFHLVQGSRQTVRRPTPAVERTFQGWASDGSRSVQEVTGYVTARVLAFLVRYHDALSIYRQHQVMSRYSGEPRPPRRETLWEDVRLSLAVRPSPDRDPLGRLRDPFEEARLAPALKEHFVGHVQRSSIRRPARGELSLFVVGPVGAGKSTLASRLAEALDWPLLILSSADFLRLGVGMIPATAHAIFQDLHRLRRVVVVFDECAELFRSIGRHVPTPGDSTVGDAEPARGAVDGGIMTAGVSASLKQLRDHQWLIYVMTMSCAVPDPDDELLTEGLFDFTLFLPHPVPERRKRFICDALEDVKLKGSDGEAAVTNVVGVVVASSEVALPWAVLDDVVSRTRRWVARRNAEPANTALAEGMTSLRNAVNDWVKGAAEGHARDLLG